MLGVRTYETAKCNCDYNRTFHYVVFPGASKRHGRSPQVVMPSHVLAEIFLMPSQTVLLHGPGILSQPNERLKLNLAGPVVDTFETQANILARF